ncbi:MAG: redoxin family protein [Flavobacteriales bacterium]|nr:redoxin family protein [Flavobacteriales bacterium]
MRLSINLFSLVLPFTAVAQLPNGSTAPDFTLTDYYGTPHMLYDYLDAGKTVFMEVFAAHCPTCWAYHQTHRLKNLHLQYGPDGTDELMVLALEHDQWNGHNEFIGIGPPWTTAGNWLEGTPYPIFDVEDPDRGVFDDYQVTFYPIIYKICPDRVLERVMTFETEAQLYQKVQDCQTALSILEVGGIRGIRYDPLGHDLLIATTAPIRSVTIMDLGGRVVLGPSVPLHERISLATLSSGIFLVEAVTDHERVVDRIHVTAP